MLWKGARPIMTDALSRTVLLGPPRLLGFVAFEPLLELLSSHVDCGVEISTCRRSQTLESDRKVRMAHWMTSSSLLTILKRVRSSTGERFVQFQWV